MQNGISLVSVLAIIISLCNRAFYIWRNDSSESIVHFWKRAYEGPILKDLIREEIEAFLPTVRHILRISEVEFSKIDIDGGIKFWTIDNSDKPKIDTEFPGPHSVFLPFSSERSFIDYAWIYDRLYYLFWNVNIRDQNFKGVLLEELLRKSGNVLPPNGCHAYDGSRRQIDGSIIIEDILVIFECRSKGISIGFQRGDLSAIKHRELFLQKILTDIDEKARWLVKHPKGSNNDVGSIRFILPVGVTPFVEYIPSTNEYYWINDNMPRILSIEEIMDAISQKSFKDARYNLRSL